MCTQDIEGDRRSGAKSTPLLFGHERAKFWLTGFAGCMVSGLALVGHSAGQPWPYFATVAACAAHLTWQVGDEMGGSGQCMITYGCAMCTVNCRSHTQPTYVYYI